MPPTSQTSRARPLSVEDRRASIVDAVIPLLLEKGRHVTSREIATAAGVAEGTVFRAFGDKESVIAAALDKHFDPTPLRQDLAAIDPDQPFEDKIRTVIELLQARFSGMFRMVAAVGERPVPPHAERLEYATIVARVLEPDLALLTIPAERVAPLLRLIAFSSSIEPLHAGHPFTVDELARFAAWGVAGRPPAGTLAPGALAPADPNPEPDQVTPCC